MMRLILEKWLIKFVKNFCYLFLTILDYMISKGLLFMYSLLCEENRIIFKSGFIMGILFALGFAYYFADFPIGVIPIVYEQY